MGVALKPLEEQVIVITGASSGIGRAAAEMAAERGARLVLAARNEDALREVAGECTRRGGQAVVVAADVAKREDIERARIRLQPSRTRMVTVRRVFHVFRTEISTLTAFP